jgi:hypothetical protein
VFIALYCWDLLYRYVKPNHFFRVLTYSSKHITLIYLIQWVLISALLPVWGYQRFGLGVTMLVIVPITATVYLLSALINAGRRGGFSI